MAGFDCGTCQVTSGAKKLPKSVLRLLEAPLCLLVALRSLQDEPEVSMRLRQPGIEADGITKGTLGALQVAQALQIRSESFAGVCAVGGQVDGTPASGSRVSGAARGRRR